jgi:hypothetical protein
MTDPQLASPDGGDDITRYTLILPTEVHTKLLAYRVTQSEAIVAFVTQHKPEEWAPIFTAIRTEKVVARTGKKAVLKKLAKLSPAQLAQALAYFEASK